MNYNLLRKYHLKVDGQVLDRCTRTLPCARLSSWMWSQILRNSYLDVPCDLKGNDCQMYLHYHTIKMHIYIYICTALIRCIKINIACLVRISVISTHIYKISQRCFVLFSVHDLLCRYDYDRTSYTCVLISDVCTKYAK